MLDGDICLWLSDVTATERYGERMETKQEAEPDNS
jgi:hypothetical protein